MKNQNGKTALKVSVPAVIILLILKLISVLINGKTNDQAVQQPAPEQVTLNVITEVTEAQTEVILTETEYVSEITELPETPDVYEIQTETEAEQKVKETLPAEDPVSDELQEVYSDDTAYVFRNSTLLENHYKKHGIEMGFASAEEYEEAASAVVNSPDALHKKEKDDNDDVYYIEDTNEFVVVSSDGYLRTYFLPDKGKAYYDRQ